MFNKIWSIIIESWDAFWTECDEVYRYEYGSYSPHDYDQPNQFLKPPYL